MRGRNAERGSAAVEFALMLPVLVVLVFGIAEFGRIYHVQTTISGAAREGVRSMALTGQPVHRPLRGEDGRQHPEPSPERLADQHHAQ